MHNELEPAAFERTVAGRKIDNRTAEARRFRGLASELQIQLGRNPNAAERMLIMNGRHPGNALRTQCSGPSGGEEDRCGELPPQREVARLDARQAWHGDEVSGCDEAGSCGR